MSELQTTKITDRAGTGSPNFSQGLKISGADSGLLAPTRTEGNTEPSTPANGDTWYDTDNDTYDVYINDEWKRVLGAAAGPVQWTVDLSNVTYDSVSLSVAAEDSGTRSLAFNNDGTKMYVLGSSTNTIYQYTLSTAFDLSTASYDSVSFSVASQDSSPTGLSFNNDGTKMYMVGFTNDLVHQYTLSTGFDLSTASYDSVSFSVASQDDVAVGLAFNNDGTKMYMLGFVSGSVHQYTLSTGFDLSTASYDSVSFNMTGQDSSARSITFDSDGNKMYLAGADTDTAYQYTLSTAFDLSTASYDSVSFSVASQDSNPYDIAFSNDGSKMYMLGFTSNTVYQYSTGL